MNQHIKDYILQMFRAVALVSSLVLLTVFWGCGNLRAQNRQKARYTICNPLDLDYRFCLDTPSRREAADPAVIVFKGEYYLFASKSGGYWHSPDLKQWKLIKTNDLPLEDYAPTAVVIGDTVLFMASTGKDGGKIYKTGNPQSGKWTVANPAFPISLVDPDLFLDDDNRLYLYYGCSNINPIFVVELDMKTLMPKAPAVSLINSDRSVNGWERSGEHNELPTRPWIEGAWMTKVKGKYYLQYACPETEFKSYSDGLYTGDSPVGPFHLAPNNPFSARQGGFIGSAGHSSTFQDKYGNYWRISTMTISVHHRYERRLGIFPAFFRSPDDAYTYTGYGDYPFFVPDSRISGPPDLATGWALLSYNKPVSVSSQIKGHEASLATDEDVRTYWSAATGSDREWISMDLKARSRINAIQINFADYHAGIYGRKPKAAYDYLLEVSADNAHWTQINNTWLTALDNPHPYIELAKPVIARYVRIRNVSVPGGTFALWGLRIFGKPLQQLPKEKITFTAVRDSADRCRIRLKWPAAQSSAGYNIKYGIAPGKLYQNYQVNGKNGAEIGNLNSKQSYYFTVERFNENGIVKSGHVVFIK
ncbi:family 43 glycosylhydrolase [Mucilaginibacter sp. AW1-7]|uniref:family 43 glycosylhydrolase n=1 Tax=Mucilaginibacter sp. AW1-7 TaxID=3349874 RepID=UPI003F740B1B